MVGVQGDPLVQHLPADAQLWVTALEELQGHRCHPCAASKGLGQPRSAAPLVPNLLPLICGALIEEPPHAHPHVLPPLQPENPSPVELWGWRCGSCAPGWL